MQLSIKKGDYPRAFAHGRAGAGPHAGRGPAHAGALAERRSEALAPEQAVVALSQFDNELAVWVIRRDRTDVVMRPIYATSTRNDWSRGSKTRFGTTPAARARAVSFTTRFFDRSPPVLQGPRGSSSFLMRTYEDAAFAAFVGQLAPLPGRGRHAEPGAKRRRVCTACRQARRRSGRRRADDSWRPAQPTRRRSPPPIRRPRPVTGSSATRHDCSSEAPAAFVVHLSAHREKRGLPVAVARRCSRTSRDAVIRARARADIAPSPCPTPIWS